MSGRKVLLCVLLLFATALVARGHDTLVPHKHRHKARVSVKLTNESGSDDEFRVRMQHRGRGVWPRHPDRLHPNRDHWKVDLADGETEEHTFTVRFSRRFTESIRVKRGDGKVVAREKTRITQGGDVTIEIVVDDNFDDNDDDDDDDNGSGTRIRIFAESGDYDRFDVHELDIDVDDENRDVGELVESDETDWDEGEYSDSISVDPDEWYQVTVYARNGDTFETDVYIPSGSEGKPYTIIVQQ